MPRGTTQISREGAGLASGRLSSAWRERGRFDGGATPSAGVGLLLSIPFILFAAFFIVYPFVRLAILSLSEPRGFGHYREFFASEPKIRALITTFAGSAGVALLAIVFGALVAWSLRTTESRRMKLVILTAIFLPFWMGSVVKIYAFTVLLGRMGIVNRVLRYLHVTDHPLSLMYNPLAVVIEMTYQMLPYAVIPLYVAFLSIDVDLVRAAESLGASRVRALLNIVVPQALPGIFATGTLVYVISLGFYLAPILMGGATRPFSASLISQDVFQYYDLSGAAVSSIILLMGAVLFVLIAFLAVGRKRLSRAIG